MDKPLRIIIAKPGLDGHDRGAKVVARALRDAGHEVIYTGLRRTPAQIIETVRDEDARLLGLSSLSGAHGHLFPRICETLRENDMGDVIVFGGGLIEAMPQYMLPLIEKKARNRVLPSLRDVYKIKEAKLGDDAGVMGAAALAKQSVDSIES